MSNKKQAIFWLESGKKIRRPSWNPESYLHLKGQIIYNDQNKKVDFSNINSWKSMDWELFKEKEFCLQDKIDYLSDNWGLSIPNVQKFIKQVKEDCASFQSASATITVLNKRAGDTLCRDKESQNG